MGCMALAVFLDSEIAACVPAARLPCCSLHQLRGSVLVVKGPRLLELARQYWHTAGQAGPHSAKVGCM